MARKLAAELIGTALLVYFAVGVATLSFGFKATGDVSVAADGTILYVEIHPKTGFRC